ncbi:hypothetical protein C7B62_08275 [Pleurocapsa sp. CCALA 161]|uniref:right-handed parallel beta-helix repeat-containing protein n=1 Tax=Pleurocapsa sp. CCALA 161 TaxID=2107688 RepID=UPI000D06D3E9|nr:right-handed parallel beta-helix repeat-containing protein [Pleurocapsa sp. CCALA 161]PSB10683.1 hypothetical protein C7B62_08275 [Pleurocapsa sp. CCALA 161]
MSIEKLKAVIIFVGAIVSLGMSGCEAGGYELEGYFVSSQGSDDNPGTIKQPFKTIQKCADVVEPGSTCWIRKGTYREKVRPQTSGTESEPITFAAYKEEQVTISGTELVTDWSKDRDAIYRARIELPVDGYSDTGFFANQIFVGGKMMPEARFPNLNPEQDFLRPNLLGGGIKSLGGTAATIENEAVPELTEGWKGGRVWANEWYTTRTGEITGGTAKQLLATMTAAWDRGAYWFYLFGKQELLDDRGEWFYNGDKQEVYLWSPDNQAPKNVEVKQRNLAFDLSDRSYITVRNLNLFANTITTSDRSSGVIIDGVRAKYVSHHMTLPPVPESEKPYEADDAMFLAAHAHDTGIQLRGNDNVLKNSVIDWSSGNGVLLEGNNHQVTNNIIVNTNYQVTYAAPVRVNGNGHQISHNTIKRTGRDGINFDWHTAGTDGRNLEISYNDISEFGMLSTDLGAIYACCHVNLAGGSIHHNWIHDAQSFSPFWGTRGIYLDLETFNSTVHHNVVWNLNGSDHNLGIVAGSPRGDDRVFNNTFLGKVLLDGENIEARNNIFATAASIGAKSASHNLFIDTDAKFTRLPQAETKSATTPDFTLQKDSPAIDVGIEIPEITVDFKGKSPDLGAYEYNSPAWKAGSSLKYTENNY